MRDTLQALCDRFITSYQVVKSQFKLSLRA